MPKYKDQTGKIASSLFDMQNLYQNLETEFLQFNEIVPYAHNPWSVYSPKLVNILQNIGPQIYGMFEIICKQQSVNSKDFKFPQYYDTINRNNILSSQYVMLWQNGQKVIPYQKNVTDYPWWTSYNKVKHELPDGIFEAKYESVINALAALFVLHHIADTIQLEKNPHFEKEDIMNSANWLEVFTRGNYYYYKSDIGMGSSLYESFQSRIFSIGRRFLPLMKGQNVQPKLPEN